MAIFSEVHRGLELVLAGWRLHAMTSGREWDLLGTAAQTLAEDFHDRPPIAYAATGGDDAAEAWRWTVQLVRVIADRMDEVAGESGGPRPVVVGGHGGGPATGGPAGAVMTYGLRLDQVHGHLVEARSAIGQAVSGDIADAPTVVAHRDAFLGQLNRLVLLAAGFESRAGSSVAAPPNADAARAAKDPTVRILLRAMPAALGTAGSSSDTLPRSAVAELLRSATQAASVAGDILASHVDPTNGPRTPEGAAIRLGAGRPAALANLARLALDLVHVDEELLKWVRHSMPPQLRAGSALHQALTVRAQRTDLEQLAVIGGPFSRPDLVRQLEVAPVLAAPDRARTPDTGVECAELIDDFRLWTFRHRDAVSGLHLVGRDPPLAC